MLFASLSVQQMREREKQNGNLKGGWRTNVKWEYKVEIPGFFFFFLSRLLYGFFYKKEERATGIAQYISKRKKKRDTLAEMYRSVDFAFGLDLLHILLCHYCICRVYGGYFLFFFVFVFLLFYDRKRPASKPFSLFLLHCRMNSNRQCGCCYMVKRRK